MGGVFEYTDSDLTSAKFEDLNDSNIPCKAHIDQFVTDTLAGGDISKKLYTYSLKELDTTYQGTGAGASFTIQLEQTQNGATTNQGETQQLTIQAGTNITVTKPLDNFGNELDTGGIRINAEVEDGPTVEVGASAPDLSTGEYKEGDLWYNTQDGRLYIVYDAPHVGDTTSSTLYWVDASPAALNGDDFLKKAGDEVTGNLTVDGSLSLKRTDGIWFW